MNTQMYAFALRNTTVNHIRGCVVNILYPTLPRFQSKMAIVWDRSIVSFIVRVSLKLVYFVDLICCQAMVLDRSQDVPVAFIRLMISMLLETACDTNIFLFYNNLTNYLLKCD